MKTKNNLIYSTVICTSIILTFLITKYFYVENKLERNDDLSLAQLYDQPSSYHKNIMTLFDEDYSWEDLPPDSKGRLFAAKMHYYREKIAIIRDFASRIFILKEGNDNFKYNNIFLPSIDKLLVQDIPKQVLLKYYKKNKDKFPANKDLNKILFQIKYKLTLNEVIHKFKKIVSNLENNQQLSYLLKVPKLTNTNIFKIDHPSIGSGKNEIVIISDYFCKSCADKLKDLTKLMKRYKFKYTQINYSNNFNSINQDFNLASRCIYKQSNKKFWIFHNLLLNEQTHYKFNSNEHANAKEVITKIITTMDVDIKEYINCFKKKKIFTKYFEQISDYINYNDLSKSPTIIINNAIPVINDMRFLKGIEKYLK